MTSKHLPYFVRGEVVKGFGRGSKQLGCPTANFPNEVVSKLPEEIGTGVYYGLASVDKGQVHKMVMSIGWNPYFNNTVKSMETHILHKFQGDFYGQTLKVAILGFLREMKNFSSLDELIQAINKDIEDGTTLLETPEMKQYETHSFFAEN